MKIYFTILLFFLFLSCQKFITDENLNSVQGEAIKLKELTNFKESYVCTGSFKIKNDTVVTKFIIESEYSLMVIKLKNVSKNYKLNYFANTNCSPWGQFTIIDAPLYEVNFSPSIFTDSSKIKDIDLISDKEIRCQINTDTIKCFNLDFNKYAIKFNDQDDKSIYGELEHYGQKKISANVLFYKIGDETYLFIMTPIKGKAMIKDGTLFNYLFPPLNKES